MTTSSNEDRLSDLERQIGAILPLGYRHFLVSQDDERKDGRFYLSYVDQRGKRIQSWIDRLYTISGAMPLGWVIDVHRSRVAGDGLIPSNAIPIGKDPGHADILLFVTGPRRGQIWIKDWYTLETEDVDQPDDDVYMLADSFETFLAMLTTDPGWFDD